MADLGQASKGESEAVFKVLRAQAANKVPR